jgi:hypothetical protein
MKLEYVLLLMPDPQEILIVRKFNIFYYGNVSGFFERDKLGAFTTRELLGMNVKQIRNGFQDTNVIHIELF